MTFSPLKTFDDIAITTTAQSIYLDNDSGVMPKSLVLSVPVGTTIYVKLAKDNKQNVTKKGAGVYKMQGGSYYTLSLNDTLHYLSVMGDTAGGLVSMMTGFGELSGALGSAGGAGGGDIQAGKYIEKINNKGGAEITLNADDVGATPKIVSTPTLNTDAANKDYVDKAGNMYLDLNKGWWNSTCKTVGGNVFTTSISDTAIIFQQTDKGGTKGAIQFANGNVYIAPGSTSLSSPPFTFSTTMLMLAAGVSISKNALAKNNVDVMNMADCDARYAKKEVFEKMEKELADVKKSLEELKVSNK